jgi:putative membrane protein
MRRFAKFGTCAALTAAFAFSVGAGPALAQDGAPPPAAPNTQSDSTPPNQTPEAPANQPMRHTVRANAQPMTDAQFAKVAAQGGDAEVKLGQLAMQNGSSDSVKNFGKKMMDDHMKAGDHLKAAATQANIDLPTGLSPQDQATYDRLEKLTGADFDKAYARDMVRDHVHDIAAFKQESASGTQPNIKEFATRTLPTLEGHLREARAMARDVGVQPRSANNRMGASPANGDPAAQQPAPQK